MRHTNEMEPSERSPRGGGPALQLLRGGAARPLPYGTPQRRRRTRLPLDLAPLAEALPAVRYRWDEDTAILVARLVGRSADPRLPGSGGAVELEGHDGSWVTLECRAGALCGLQVAVWPAARTCPALAAPALLGPPAVLRVPVVAALAPGAADGSAGFSDVEVETALALDVDEHRRTYHLRVGPLREVRVVRVGRDMLVDVDAAGDLAGLWLLGVPPLPFSR